MIARPKHLPDFANPPLHEVVLGVQFSPPKGYQQVRITEVWELFKADYPIVQEQQALEPTFETFGLPQEGRREAPPLRFVSSAVHDRYWFLRPDQVELLQFQQDRFLHNWRKVGDSNNEYPRFERMFDLYTRELNALEGYFSSLSPQKLAINQCEISYINHIGVGADPLKVADWLPGFALHPVPADDFRLYVREVIRNEADEPIGRITYDAVTGALKDGRRMIVLTITARGAPRNSDVNSALDFINLGRDLIVTRFAQITSESAHQHWQRLA